MTEANDDQPEGGQSEEPYAIGHGKPPLHTRFKPGNKLGKGRPKGVKNMKTLATSALAAKVQAKVDGRMKNVTKMELAMHQLANRGASGDLKAIGKLIDLHERYGPQDDISGPSPAETNANLDTLRDYLAMVDMFPKDTADPVDV